LLQYLPDALSRDSVPISYFLQWEQLNFPGLSNFSVSCGVRSRPLQNPFEKRDHAIQRRTKPKVLEH
jgi:hypothetical protein